jgi:hypothetical protein
MVPISLRALQTRGAIFRGSGAGATALALADGLGGGWGGGVEGPQAPTSGASSALPNTKPEHRSVVLLMADLETGMEQKGNRRRLDEYA